MDAFETIMLSLAIAMGLGSALMSIGAVAHHLVGAARAPWSPTHAQADAWATRVDPDLLVPPPLRRPGVLLVVDQRGGVRVVTDRVAPPRERGPEVLRG